MVALLYKRRVSRATGLPKTTTIPALSGPLSTLYDLFAHL